MSEAGDSHPSTPISGDHTVEDEDELVDLQDSKRVNIPEPELEESPVPDVEEKQETTEAVPEEEPESPEVPAEPIFQPIEQQPVVSNEETEIIYKESPTLKKEETLENIVQEEEEEEVESEKSDPLPLQIEEKEDVPLATELSEVIPSSQSSETKDSQLASHPEPLEMEDTTSTQLDCLKLQENEPEDQRVILNNENETLVSPGAKTPVRSGIRPPTAVLRQPKPVVAAPPPASRPQTTPARRSIPPPSVVASPRPASKMSRERSDVQKSTSTRSINDVGKFTPKVNVKFVNVKSKVGSVTNHKPGGGNVEIFSEKKEYNVQSKVGSLKNSSHVAGGGNVQIESRKLDFSHASPKVGSKTNYVPAKSDVKIVSEKLTWNAKSKVGSMDNATHKATGGNVQVISSQVAINPPTVVQVTARPKMSSTMLEKKGNKRRSISQRSSSSSLLQSKQFPGAIYPLSSDFLFH